MLQQKSLDKLDIFFSKYKAVQYKPRTVITPAHDLPSSIFYIKSGFLRVFRISEHGEELTLTILKPKDLFPLTYGMTGINRSAGYYLETITNIEIWKVHLDQFNQFITTEPEIYTELTKNILIRFNDTLSKMEYLIFNNASTNIIATLISCAKKFGVNQGNDIIINVPLTHKDIATLVGITRETTSIEMKKLEKKGLIKRAGKHLRIRHLDKLEELFTLQAGAKSSHNYAI